MYSVVMVVAMAGAPEAPTCCCWQDCCFKSCCNKGNNCGNSKGCCDKNYAKAAPVAVAPAPVAVAPAPVAVAPAQDCGKGYGGKGCCFDLCCWKKCCDKGYSKGNDCGKGYSKGGDCGKGTSGKGCCFCCCDKGGYAAAPVVVPVETPKKDMPKVEVKPKVGG
jgi:hypothetical protein